eukprot:1161028-Pelagomonas_calceolata.AAC.2
MSIFAGQGACAVHGSLHTIVQGKAYAQGAQNHVQKALNIFQWHHARFSAMDAYFVTQDHLWKFMRK